MNERDNDIKHFSDLMDKLRSLYMNGKRREMIVLFDESNDLDKMIFECLMVSSMLTPIPDSESAH